MLRDRGDELTWLAIVLYEPTRLSTINRTTLHYYGFESGWHGRRCRGEFEKQGWTLRKAAVMLIELSRYELFFVTRYACQVEIKSNQHPLVYHRGATLSACLRTGCWSAKSGQCQGRTCALTIVSKDPCHFLQVGTYHLHTSLPSTSAARTCTTSKS